MSKMKCLNDTCKNLKAWSCADLRKITSLTEKIRFATCDTCFYELSSLNAEPEKTIAGERPTVSKRSAKTSFYSGLINGECRF